MKFKELDMMSRQNDFFHECLDCDMYVEAYYWMIIRKYETKYLKWNKFGTQDSETQYF